MTTHSLLKLRPRALFAICSFLGATVAQVAVAQIGTTPSSGGQSRAPTGIESALKHNQAEPDFLPPDQAFRFNALADGPDKIRLIWEITDGYYLYRARISATSDGAKLGALTLPTGETKIDDYFGKQEVYHHDIVGSITVSRSGSGEQTVPLKVTYQGCAMAGLCYPPITKKVSIALPPAGGKVGGAGGGMANLTGDPASSTGRANAGSGESGMANLVGSAGNETATLAGGASGNAGAAGGPDGAHTAAGSAGVTGATGAGNPGAHSGVFVSAQDRMVSVLRDGSLLAVLGFFFLSGLGLSLTPCVLPMVPILSGILAGEGANVTRWRGFSLSFTYVQGMALTYAGAGAAFVLAFKQAPQAFFQQPWIVALFVILFVALAFAMFGTFTLQMPSAIQTRLANVSNKQRSGTFIGCFVMGALSALVATACVAPALIAALTVISQTGEVARGAAALYATALGMGVPLLVVGASAGSLLPKAGPWMDTIKSLFGVVFLGLAIYFLQPLVPDSISMLLWSALAVISGFWIFAMKARDGGPAPAALRAAGLLTLVYGIILLIGVAAGSNDPLQPLSTLRADNKSGSTEVTAKEPALAFDTIKSLDDLNKRVAAAGASGRPVMLDFYADWCTSCKEMERYTFSDKTVQDALSNAVLLHADVTKNDATDQELLRHFGIFGPPTIAFYGPDGEERANFRVVGYMKAAEFASLARRAFSRNLSVSNTAAPPGAP
jgi:thiol:disulfide interchange protein